MDGKPTTHEFSYQKILEDFDTYSTPNKFSVSHSSLRHICMWAGSSFPL